MNFLPPINPKTGKCDGLYYTFGSSEVCLVLAHRLLTSPNKMSFNKVTAKLAHYTDGLRTLAMLPKDAPFRDKICLMWRDKCLAEFEQLISKEEGKTFLLNLAKQRYRDILLRADHVASNTQP